MSAEPCDGRLLQLGLRAVDARDAERFTGAPGGQERLSGPVAPHEAHALRAFAHQRLVMHGAAGQDDGARRVPPRLQGDVEGEAENGDRKIRRDAAGEPLRRRAGNR